MSLLGIENSLSFLLISISTENLGLGDTSLNWKEKKMIKRVYAMLENGKIVTIEKNYLIN